VPAPLAAPVLVAVSASPSLLVAPVPPIDSEPEDESHPHDALALALAGPGVLVGTGQCALPVPATPTRSLRLSHGLESREARDDDSEPTGSIFIMIGDREVCLSTTGMTEDSEDRDSDSEEYKEEVRKNNVEFNAMFGATPEDAWPDGDVEDILKSWARPADSSWDLSAAQRVPAPPGF
jgi:hypothetical protein